MTPLFSTCVEHHQSPSLRAWNQDSQITNNLEQGLAASASNKRPDLVSTNMNDFGYILFQQQTLTEGYFTQC